MEFQPVKAEDKEIINQYFAQRDSRQCDMSFASVYLWRKFYPVTYSICEDFLIFKSEKGETISFSFPIGKKDCDPGSVIEKLMQYCQEQGKKIGFHCISHEDEAYLQQHYPERFRIIFDRDYAQYIYECQALIDLRGKKYHGKKNHVNKFKKMNEWSYEVIDETNTEECIEMLEAWRIANCSDENRESHQEICACREALYNRELLGLKGGLIRAQGRIVAFTLGEKINSDTLDIHFEKAYSDVPGAYSIINQEFLIRESDGCQYVNREEDLGEPGLRKAKLSYHPVFMEEPGYAQEIK